MSDMTNQNPEVGYAVLDKRKSRRAYALSPDQIWWISIWMAPTLFIAIQWFNADLRLLAIVPLVMCVGAWKTSHGIIYRNFQADFEDWRLKRRGGVIYDGATTKKPPLGLKVTSFESLVDTSQITQLTGDVLDPEQLQSIIDNNSSRSFSVGTIYSSRERTDTSYISGTGLKGSNGNPQDLFMSRKGVADGFVRAIGLYPKPPSICMIYSRRPVNPIPQLLWDHESIDPAVQQARQLALKDMGRDSRGREQLDVEGFFTDTTVEERQRAALDLARAGAAVDDEEVTQLIAVSFKRPRFIGAKRGEFPKLSPRQLRRMPIKRLAEEFAREMDSAGVTDVQVLDRTDVKKVIRTGNDIADIQKWQEDVYDWAVEIEETGDPDLPMPTPWPSTITSGRTASGKVYTKIGNTYFMVKQVAGYTKSYFLADALFSLFDTSVPEFQPSRYTGLTISFCSDIINVEAEDSILTRKRAFAAGVERARGKGSDDEITTAKDDEKRQALANKQNALWYGGVYAMLYNAYVTVAALTLEMLEEADESIDARGRSAGVEFRHIDNEVRHARSLITALYGVNMINR